MSKQFIIAWGAGYTHAHGVIDNPDEFFSEDRGFGKDDVEAINALEVAEAHRCNDMWVCSVLRIEDDNTTD